MSFQGRSTTKRTGGRRRRTHKKKKHQLGDEPTETRVGETTLKTIDTRGGSTKVRALRSDVASVADGETVTSASIENVDENGANPNYARRNIITRGAKLETSEGRARVTSRPGQDGQINAVSLE
jgi:small subunit ribosomal protein S8e